MAFWPFFFKGESCRKTISGAQISSYFSIDRVLCKAARASPAKRRLCSFCLSKEKMTSMNRCLVETLVKLLVNCSIFIKIHTLEFFAMVRLC